MQKNSIAAFEANSRGKFGVRQVDLKKLKTGTMEKLERGERKTVSKGSAFSAQLNGERKQLIFEGWLKVNCGDAGYGCWESGEGYF